MIKRYLTVPALVLAILASLGMGITVQADDTLSASISAPASANVGESINLSVTATGGNGSYTYNWDFGDGTQASGQAPVHSYSTAGTKTINVVVGDTDNKQASDSINLTIESGAVTPAPVVDLKINDNNGPITLQTPASSTLAWTVTNSTSCTASGAWSGSKSASGTEAVGSFSGNTVQTFTLTCTGAGGTTSDSVTLNVAAGGVIIPTNLTISNVRVTDVTKTSAIVRWDTVDSVTNLPLAATSQVFYDTTSHPGDLTLSQVQSLYAHSTTRDSALVTTHAVTVTGLSSNTHYYFRVISEN